MKLREDLRRYLVRSVPAVAAVPLGFLAFFGPAMANRLVRGQPITVESLGAAQENCGALQLILLAVVGIGMAWFTDSPSPMIGALTVASLPVWSLIDVADAYRNGVERHNLLPFEWAFYASYGLFPTAGALLVRATQRRGLPHGPAG